MQKYKCPVCKNYTIDEPGEYDICPICGWEDEDMLFPWTPSGANGWVNQSQARRKFRGGNPKRSIKEWFAETVVGWVLWVDQRLGTNLTADTIHALLRLNWD